MRAIVRVTALVASAVVTLSLAGCSLWHDGEDVVGQLREGINAHNVLVELAESLRERPEVASVETSLIPIDRTVGVTIRMAPHASAAASAEVALLADAALRSEALAPYARTLDVSAPSGHDEPTMTAAIRLTDFDAKPLDFLAEFSYWQELRALVGSPLDLRIESDRAGALRRILSTHVDATVASLAYNAEAIRAVAQPSPIETAWRFPGLLGYAEWAGPLPDDRLLLVLADMQKVTNLLDDSGPEAPPGIYLIVSSADPRPPHFGVVASAPGIVPDADTVHELTLALVRAAEAAGLSAYSIGIDDVTAPRPTQLHRGDCLDAFPPSSEELRSLDRLIAEGVDVPRMSAGVCLAFATP